MNIVPSKKKKKPTINDVANLAGVSKKTASRVLNNSPSVSDATREKVTAVMKKLNYVPDPQARGLAFKRSFIVGLVYDNPNVLYISDIQKGVLKACKGTGYELIMHPGDFNSEHLIEEVCDFATRARVDGIILLSPISQIDELAKRLENDQVPYVRISPKKIDIEEKTVISNDKLGAELMTEYLVSIGHRNIGFIKGPECNLSTEQKYQGFCKIMQKYNLPIQADLIIKGENTFESGIQSGNKLLAMKPNPTAIFASNDFMALGVMRAASMLNISIPEQLSIAGFDDSAIATVVWPDLTTIHQSAIQMGQMAANKLLVQLGSNNTNSNEVIEILPELVVRNSTKKAS
ncbi:MAG: LacI family DNA-binding transcriptional regulator [Colwellia sp.]|nr:LacI family DNA-binding transcriptional regulator [Colwellia sp.]